MKKSFLSIFAVCAIVFSSCTDNPETVGGEDKGTSTETTAINADVNPNHIRGYGDDTEAANQYSAMHTERANKTASRMATDLQLDEDTQRRVLQVYTKHERRMADLENRYNYSETARMGGEANNDTENDMNNNTNTIMDANRQNNAGNDYAGNEEMDRAGAENMRPSEEDMNTERSQIMQETERELQEILTPEQFSMYQQNRASYDSNQAENQSSNAEMNSGGNQTQPATQNQNDNMKQEQNTTQNGTMKQGQQKQN